MGAVSTVAKGVIAGAVGTLAMDALWWSRSRRSGSDADFAEWEFSTGEVDSFEDASSPAKVGSKAADAVGVELPDERAGLVNDVVHWGTGIGYGVGHAMFTSSRGPIVGGLLTGVGAFANSYATLGAIGVYEPIWEYDPKTLAKDLSAHLVYGLGAGLTYAALSRSDGSDGAGDS